MSILPENPPETAVDYVHYDAKPDDKLASASGGIITFMDPEHGDILAEIAVPAGMTDVRPYLDLLPDGAVIALSPGLTPLRRQQMVRPLDYGEGAYHSGANPDWKPTRLSPAEMEMRRMISALQSDTKRIAARQAAVQQIDAMPTAKPDPEPVIEAVQPQEAEKPA